MKALKNAKGQSLVEYLVIVALVGVSTIVVMKSVGQNIKVQFGRVAQSLGGKVDGELKADPITQNMLEKKDLRNFMEDSLNQK